MKVKLYIIVFALFVIMGMGVYFITHPSYEKSLRAKYYYEMGDYKKAYGLSKEAFGLNSYNRMASTIMTQSQTSLKYVDYILLGKKYTKEIDALMADGNITDAKKAKIKMMCKIMLLQYTKLAPSVVTNKELVKEAAKYYDSFRKLLEEIDH